MHHGNHDTRSYMLLNLAMSCILVTLVAGASPRKFSGTNVLALMEPCETRYRIEPDCLSSNKNAIIYKAHNKTSNSAVIVKAFYKQAAFDSEAKAFDMLAKRISAAAIPYNDADVMNLEPLWRFFVCLLRKCRHKGKAALVVEFLDKVLSNVIVLNKLPLREQSNASPFENPAAAFKSYAYHILRAVCALHTVGVFHLDLKPDNIGLTLEGDLKLFDFGFASTRSPFFYAGTIEYSAPEMNIGFRKALQASHQVDKMDIWSVGCTIYEIFTGKKLFDTIKKFSNCAIPPKPSSSELGDVSISNKPPILAIGCNRKAAYFYIKWSFGLISYEPYKSVEDSAKESCPRIFLEECTNILKHEKPLIFSYTNSDESVSIEQPIEIRKTMEQFTRDKSQKKLRLNPSCTEPDELEKLLTSLLMFDFNTRITAREALTEYHIFDAFRSDNSKIPR